MRGAWAVWLLRGADGGSSGRSTKGERRERMLNLHEGIACLLESNTQIANLTLGTKSKQRIYKVVMMNTGHCDTCCCTPQKPFEDFMLLHRDTPCRVMISNLFENKEADEQCCTKTFYSMMMRRSRRSLSTNSCMAAPSIEPCI
jgi:hypothetical protein